MTFSVYPEYKESGIEWLGKVPTHWEIIPLSKIATSSGGLFIDGDWIESKDLSSTGIRYLTSGNVGTGSYKEQGLGYISEEKFAELRCVEVFPNDILISRLNLPIGRSCLVPDLGERIVTCVDNVICRPSAEYERGFLVYLLSSEQHFANMELLGRGATMQRISRSILGNVRFPVPTVDEQKFIASFLDHETKKIDELIHEQEQLIELLNEKRQSIISNAVCRGLDPNVPMKDSGVAWLGMVPEHWAVRKIKNVCKLTTGITPPTENQENYSEDGFPWIRPEDLNEINAPTVATKFLSDSGRTYIREVRSGSTLICCIGTIGKVGLLNKPSSTNQQITAASFVGNDRYFYYLMQAARTELDVSSTGNVLKILNTERLGNIKIPIPNDVEQEGISKFLDYEISKLDSLMSESNSAVGILNERKSALISAAVCGQIDVRNFHGN